LSSADIADMLIECKHQTSGSQYAGRISRTRGGLECQTWNSQYPHQHDFQVNFHDTLQLGTEL